MNRRLCTINDCGEVHKAGGLCSMHYQRQIAAGAPVPGHRVARGPVPIDLAHHYGGVVLDDRTLTIGHDPARPRGTFTHLAYDGQVKLHVDPWFPSACAGPGWRP